MESGNREIVVSNRFLYYYANLIRRVFGMAVRRDGKNVPGTQVTGKLPGSEPDPIHRPGSKGEMVLFRYRKRLLFGLVETRQGKSLTFLAEDGRRLHARDRAVVQACGVEATTASDVRRYSNTVRALSDELDLKDIWLLTEEGGELVDFSEMAGFLWGDRVDTTQSAALHLRLHTTPYFEPDGSGRYSALPDATVRERRQQRISRDTREREREELVDWFAEKESETYDPETFTSRQRSWVEAVVAYTLNGPSSQGAEHAKQMISEVVPGTRDLQRWGYHILVRKGIWAQGEDVELLRSERRAEFPKEVEKAAVDRKPAARRRRGLRRRVLLVRGPGGVGVDDPPQEIALICRRRWWGRGWRVVVHLPDVASLIPVDSALDRAASDRMGSLPPVQGSQHRGGIPMLPEQVRKACSLEPGVASPVMSLLIDVGRGGDVRSIKIRQATVQPDSEVSTDSGDVLGVTGEGLALLDVAAVLHENRLCDSVDGGAAGTETVLREVMLLAERCLAEWCAQRDLPVIYAVRRAPDTAAEVAAIANPILRRHELRRLSPTVSYERLPDPGPGNAAACPLTRPADRYPDLVNQGQILSFLETGKPARPSVALDIIRFRAREELVELEHLAEGQNRLRLLTNMESSVGDVFDAVVLHNRRDGVLVELESLPLKTLVQAGKDLEKGDLIQVRVTGVDPWLRRLRASAILG